MRILTIILIAALVGSAIGGTAGYLEVASDRDTLGSDQPTVTLPREKSGPAPRIEVERPHFNFGRMEQGHEMSHEFIVRNTGDAPLRVWAGQTTCKCTLSEVKSGALKAGESTRVKLTWTAKSDQGPFRQSAKIHSTDPLRPEVDLEIDGEIVEATNILPRDFAFDKLAAGESESAEVYVMAMLQDKLTVTSAELTDEATRDKFDVRIEHVEREKLPLKNARDGVRITLTAKPGLPVGRFNQYLTLSTDLKDGEKLHVPVLGRVVGDISIRGSSNWLEEQGVLNLGRVESSKGKQARLNIVVRGNDADQVKFEVGSVDPPELKVTFGEPKRLKKTLLHVPLFVEVPAGTRPMIRLATAQGDEGKVVLKTTHPTMKEVSMGVRFAVEK